MHIVFFAHPDFLGHQSMPRFAHMLAAGMRARGHTVETWQPRPWLFRLAAPASLKKWLGYLDQYVVFAYLVRRRLKQCPLGTLFVFTDQALGPWVPLVSHRPHVIHCHDFLAQRSAQGSIAENPTGWTGRYYQAFIRQGYARGQHFISVSHKTRDDLHRFLSLPPQRSEVVYNGLNQAFLPLDPPMQRAKLGQALHQDLMGGYLLHVGGNHWYKNRSGVIEIYDAWRAGGGTLPLLLVGEKPTAALLAKYENSPYKEQIYLVSGLSDELVRTAYAGATVFLFPSLAEGFGWPIAEAMASGCPVVTTNEAPMTEVAGSAGFLIPRRPQKPAAAAAWAEQAAQVVQQLVTLPAAERAALIRAGLTNAQRFDPSGALNQIESIYRSIT